MLWHACSSLFSKTSTRSTYILKHSFRQAKFVSFLQPVAHTFIYKKMVFFHLRMLINPLTQVGFRCEAGELMQTQPQPSGRKHCSSCWIFHQSEEKHAVRPQPSRSGAFLHAFFTLPMMQIRPSIRCLDTPLLA